MLHGITWLQFLSYTGGALLLYYLVLFVMFGKEGLVKGRLMPGQSPTNISGKKRIWRVEEQEVLSDDPANRAIEDDQPVDEEYASNNDPDDQSSVEIQTDQEEELFDKLELLASNIQQTITTAVHHTDKATLFHQLQKQIAQYPDLLHPSFRVAITNLIIRQAKLECEMTISSDEVAALWNY